MYEVCAPGFARPIGQASTEAREREELGKVNQPLGFSPLFRRELLAGILAVEEGLEPVRHSVGQPGSRQLSRDLDGLDYWCCSGAVRRQAGSSVTWLASG